MGRAASRHLRFARKGKPGSRMHSSWFPSHVFSQGPLGLIDLGIAVKSSFATWQMQGPRHSTRV
eukprot:4288888-Pyramimonas_sp.AAC.1